MKQLVTLLAWIITAPALLVALVAVGYQLHTSTEFIIPNPLHPVGSHQTVNASDAIISNVKGISTDVQTGDARPIIIAEFLATNDSPLKPYDYWGQFLTDLADRYDMDFRLMPSIAMQESNLCKKIPEGSHNCLGLGIHSQGTWGFDRYEDNFEAAAKILKQNYINEGYITPDEIQDKYTPGSNGSWEFAVNHFMEVLEHAEF